MDIDECIRKGLIKKSRIDNELIKSIIEMADIKEGAVMSAAINEINISAYVSMAYDALREVMEAVSIPRGYKVLSHVCLGEPLKDTIGESDYNEFDRLRYARNSINYYGVRIGFDDGKSIISKILGMKNRLKENYLRAFC